MLKKALLLLFFVRISMFSIGYGQSNIIPANFIKASKLISINNDHNDVICSGAVDTLSITYGATPPANLKYVWSSLPDDSSKTAVIIAPTATTQYILTVFNDDRSVYASDSILVFVTTKPLITMFPDTICKGNEATIGVAGGNYYFWNTGGTTREINDNPLVNTIYSVRASEFPLNTLEYQNKCFQSGSTEVIVHDSSIAHTNIIDTTACLNDKLTLTVYDAKFQKWPNGDKESSYTFVVTQDTTIAVYTKDKYDCESTIDISITASSALDITITASTSDICLGDEVQLTAEGAYYYYWNTGETTPAINIHPTTNTTYTVTGTTSEDGCKTTADFYVSIKNCNKIYFPNAIIVGLGANSTNSIFKPFGEYFSFNRYYLAIFDRFGKMIYETNDYNKGWNGTVNNSFVMPGTYAYFFQVNSAGEIWETTGTVAVIRK